MENILEKLLDLFISAENTKEWLDDVDSTIKGIRTLKKDQDNEDDESKEE